jgi:hypothetical protein
MSTKLTEIVRRFYNANDLDQIPTLDELFAMQDEFPHVTHGNENNMDWMAYLNIIRSILRVCWEIERGYFGLSYKNSAAACAAIGIVPTAEFLNDYIKNERHQHSGFITKVDTYLMFEILASKKPIDPFFKEFIVTRTMRSMQDPTKKLSTRPYKKKDESKPQEAHMNVMTALPLWDSELCGKVQDNFNYLNKQPWIKDRYGDVKSAIECPTIPSIKHVSANFVLFAANLLSLNNGGINCNEVIAQHLIQLKQLEHKIKPGVMI